MKHKNILHTNSTESNNRMWFIFSGIGWALVFFFYMLSSNITGLNNQYNPDITHDGGKTAISQNGQTPFGLTEKEWEKVQAMVIHLAISNAEQNNIANIDVARAAAHTILESLEEYVNNVKRERQTAGNGRQRP